jgi:micrococcal nuclease
LGDLELTGLSAQSRIVRNGVGFKEMGILSRMIRSAMGIPSRRQVMRAILNPAPTPTRRPSYTATTLGEGTELTTQLSGTCFVVDGDTIVIGTYSIRLSGIDAPELDHPYGKNAKWHLVNLTKGQKITAEFHGDQTYAREVATCYLPDGRDLSAEMVKAGMAIDWPKFSGGKYRHLETPEARKLLWRADARQKGRWPPKTDS